jgi:hypothetical protein
MIRRTILIGLLAIASLGVTSAPVAAKTGDVISSGHCSAGSTWKLKLSPDDSRIEVEFQVDQNRNNRQWRVSLSQNGTFVSRVKRLTRAPSGSFTIRWLRPNHAGADRFVAKATNVLTGEVCRRSVSVSF